MTTFIGTQTPSVPITGMMRLNPNQNIEMFNGKVWVAVSSISAITESPLTFDHADGTVYGAQYLTVYPRGGPAGIWNDMTQWLIENYGPSESSIWGEPATTPMERWYINNSKIWFRDQKDRDWFVLRWSGDAG